MAKTKDPQRAAPEAPAGPEAPAPPARERRLAASEWSYEARLAPTVAAALAATYPDAKKSRGEWQRALDQLLTRPVK